VCRVSAELCENRLNNNKQTDADENITSLSEIIIILLFFIYVHSELKKTGSELLKWVGSSATKKEGNSRNHTGAKGRNPLENFGVYTNNVRQQP